jgi:serine protease Do
VAHTLKGGHPLDGVTVADLSPVLAMELGREDLTEGVVVVGSGTGSTGVNIGMARGDIILEVNGTKITSADQLENLMKQGQHNWQIIYQRGSNVMNLTVKM